MSHMTNRRAEKFLVQRVIEVFLHFPAKRRAA